MEFKDTINKIHKATSFRTSDNPLEFFNVLVEYLDNKYNFLTTFDNFDQIKQEILILLKTSLINDNTKEQLTNEITEINDYTRLLMYLSQQVKGL